MEERLQCKIAKNKHIRHLIAELRKTPVYNLKTELPSKTFLDLLHSLFAGQTQESAYFFTVDTNFRLLDLVFWNYGEKDHILIDDYIWYIQFTFFHERSKYIMLAHNHPSQTSFPSKKDVIYSRSLFKKSLYARIRFIESFIVTEKTVTEIFNERIFQNGKLLSKENFANHYYSFFNFDFELVYGLR